MHIDYRVISTIREAARLKSNDPKTQTASAVTGNFDRAGSTVVAPNRVLHPDPASLSREERLVRSLHSERAALLRAGPMAVDATLYSLGTPCSECAKSIVGAGILFLVIDDEMDPFKDRLHDPAYKFSDTSEILAYGGVTVFRWRQAEDDA